MRGRLQEFDCQVTWRPFLLTTCETCWQLYLTLEGRKSDLHVVGELVLRQSEAQAPWPLGQWVWAACI